MDFDPYAVLGVLPDADQVVINAAYRALAQRYHPDKWQGDKTEAHNRMAEINRAYAIIGDPSKRADFDRQHGNEAPGDFERSEDSKDAAFKDSFANRREEWSLAQEIYPDLEDLRLSLRRVSSSLAFSFMTIMLDEKLFQRRHAIARSLQDAYLTRYFGRNPRVLSYALSLILHGRRDAALKLNQYVTVLGSDADASAIISAVERQFPGRGGSARETDTRVDMRTTTYAALRQTDLPQFAVDLCRSCGYKVDETPGGFLKPALFEVTPPDGVSLPLMLKAEFIGWALGEFKRYA